MNIRRLLLAGAVFFLTTWLCILCAQAGRYTPKRYSQQEKYPPADGELIKIARATWDTGWFQTEIIRELLMEIGYRVDEPVTMDNAGFYRACAAGEIDLWANGWFPSHLSFFEEEQVRGRVVPVGFEVKAGALQGYLADKKTVDELGIRYLTDLKNPRIAKAFDRNGDGKADLIGCNQGWGCELAIEDHLDEYNLRGVIEHVQGDYSPMIEGIIKRYHRGEPILFFTWTPNWTIGSLIPGKDVTWLQLPETGQASYQQTAVKGVPGCPDNPCNMGFPPNDIRIVANTAFLKKYPDIKRLLVQVEIPLVDITWQNARMVDGEDGYEDIQRHAQEWMRENRGRVDRWLEAAHIERPSQQKGVAPQTAGKSELDEGFIRVATKRLEPFVIYQNGRYTGFSVELWQKIADKMDVSYELYGVNTMAKLLDEVRRGEVDVAIAGIGITSKRERILDFSHSFYESGLQIMVAREYETPLQVIFIKVLSILLSPGLIYGVGIFVLGLLTAAHIIWLMERRHNPAFSDGYLNGIWQSIWWAVVTVTTVGYGDKTPVGKMGRLFGMFWILAGYFVFAYFTASVTTTVALQELRGEINGPKDLVGKKVATVTKSPAADYLLRQGIHYMALEDIEDAYHLLEKNQVDAVVYDAPVLQHYASNDGKGKVEMVGLIFEEQIYGIALQEGSPYREAINLALLKLIEEDVYQALSEKWFGP